jgi:hypothetical protein
MSLAVVSLLRLDFADHAFPPRSTFQNMASARVFIFFRVVHRGKRPLLDRLGDGAEFVAFDTFETATSTGRAQHPRSYLDVNRTCRLLGELAELILRPNLRPA